MKLDSKFLAASLILLSSAAFSVPANAGGSSAYFPSASPTDGRMLSVGCPLISVFDMPTSVIIAIPAGEANFSLSIFDGDTGNTDVNDKGHWDQGTRQLTYELYFDPGASGNTAPVDLVASWTGNDANPTSNPDPDPEKAWTTSEATMLDNDWWDAVIVNSTLAQAPSGTHFYHLLIQRDGACGETEAMASDFKLGVANPATFSLSGFSLEGALRSGHFDAEILYTAWPPDSPEFFINSSTTYDGTFEIFFELDSASAELSIFDGDLDIGTNELLSIPSGANLLSCADTDDLDTPADYAGFPASVPVASAIPEGVAGIGSPPEDSPYDVYRRGLVSNPKARGCARYEVEDPMGTVYANEDLSGSDEWEQFRLATSMAPDPNNADYGPSVAADGTTFIISDFLPAGVWTLRLEGVDLANTMFWVFGEACSVRDGAAACNPPTGADTRSTR